MSREELSRFIRAAEYRSSIQRNLAKTNNFDEVIKVGEKYGFKITTKDLEQNHISEGTENWFKLSKIDPLRKPNSIDVMRKQSIN